MGSILDRPLHEGGFKIHNIEVGPEGPVLKEAWVNSEEP